MVVDNAAELFQYGGFASQQDTESSAHHYQLQGQQPAAGTKLGEVAASSFFLPQQSAKELDLSGLYYEVELSASADDDFETVCTAAAASPTPFTACPPSDQALTSCTHSPRRRKRAPTWYEECCGANNAVLLPPSNKRRGETLPNPPKKTGGWVWG